MINLKKNIYFINEIVEIHVPLPKITCSNWNDWETENVGIIYKDEQVTLAQLLQIKNLFINEPSRSINKFQKCDVYFDCVLINEYHIKQIDMIFDLCQKDLYNFLLNKKHNHSNKYYRDYSNKIITY
jgi:hypothetical protein